MPTLKPKQILAAALLLLTIVAGCKKGTVIPEKNPSDNFWIFNNIKHTVTVSNRLGMAGDTEMSIILQASGVSDVAVIDFTFKSLPTASGTYKLIRDSLSPLGDNEMNVLVNTPDTNSCAYEGEPINLQVTVINGKIKIDVPLVQVKSYDPSKPIYNLSASVYEL